MDQDVKDAGSQVVGVRPPPARFICRAVGVTFVDGYPDNVHALDPGEPIVLEHETDNEHDEWAVLVRSPSLGMLGHLPRSLAARVAPYLDAGNTIRAVVGAVLVTPGAEDLPGVSLVCERLDP